MDNIEIKTAIVKTDISDHFPTTFATKKQNRRWNSRALHF